MSEESNASKGIGFPSILTSILTIMFIGLKLAGFIEWSWWWVLSPLWISPILLIIISIVLIIVYWRGDE